METGALLSDRAQHGTQMFTADLSPAMSPVQGVTTVTALSPVSAQSFIENYDVIDTIFPPTPDGSPISDKISTDGATSIKKRKKNPGGKVLQFPPCSVCSGNASGMHYGVNSCEACKGFFRRYLLRNEIYKCTKGNNCPITNRNRGNCSGCRLQKCLGLGMAKEKVKLGRYTLSKRTETIKEVNKLEGKEQTDSVLEGLEHFRTLENAQSSDFDPHKEIISRKLSITSPNFIPEKTFSDSLVEVLVVAMRDIKPYGPSIETEEDIQKVIKLHYEKYQLKLKMYGPMKPVPKEEHYKLYKDFGIDVDNRMEDLRKSTKGIEEMIERYCSFAKHIPGFIELPLKDQSNLLKSSRADFFFILMHEGYNQEYQVFLSSQCEPYHMEECADKFFSRNLLTILGDMYCRWQKLQLSEQEKAILIALTLMFTDRCNLDNHRLVEKIQFSLTDLLRRQLAITCKASAQRRFGKIIDNLTLMRETSDLYLKEYQQLCKDEVIVEEVPMMTEFLLEDY